MHNKISKRNFLLTSAAATVATLAWEPLFLVAGEAVAPVLRRLSLEGSWQVSQVGKEEWIPATVPGGIYTDLLAAGKIPDPFFRDNESQMQWVGDADWTYQRTFSVPDEVLKNDRVLLRCEGLDTLATIKINGHIVGDVDNMFRLWEFDVKQWLRSGDNTIEVSFASPAAYMKQRESDQAPAKWIKGRAWVRKEPCSYGWDWGPVLPTCGIWKRISIEAFDVARMTDFMVQQSHHEGIVTVAVNLTVEAVPDAGRPLKAKLSIIHDDVTVANVMTDISAGQAHAELAIKYPKLWWPAGMGGQPLYTVCAELSDANGVVVDSSRRRIGLRQLRAVLPQGESPLHFEVNGIPFFAKGANWIPADSFPTRVSPEISRRYVADAAAVNMNFLRFWGGGYYEDDALFDACDEMGICVWLDFKFACAAYPSFDDPFMDNVRAETRDNLQRLRHHPCIAVWCGNNEISLLWEAHDWRDNTMGTADYDKLFKQLIAEQVQKYAPDANYVSGSPDCGDTHYWEVWHGTKTFEAYRTLNGFMSEFGYQSFPELKTIKAFTNEEDRVGVLTPVMKWHQRSGMGNMDGNAEIIHMIHGYFKEPKDFESTLWLSQILQGFGIKLGAEYWRQSMPKSMGCIFWQYNDCWPGMSWSSVDYFGRWKALHYLARKFYSPLLVSALENRKDAMVDIFVTSDLLDDQNGKIKWKVTDLEGRLLSHDALKLEIPARKSQRVRTLDLKEQVQRVGTAGLLVWLDLEKSGDTVSSNLVLLADPKELKLADPNLNVQVAAAEHGFYVTVQSEKPALWVWLNLEETDASYDDNFFHLHPESPQKILVRPKGVLSRAEFEKQLRVRSLFDTHG